jgi:hypothetical protein
MNPNYSNGKIYMIVSKHTDLCYIGSTTQTLKKRLAGHHKQTTSIQVLKYGDCEIQLLEKYPCNNKTELETRERFYIQNIKCCNKCVPTRTRSEYRKDNRSHLRQYHKEWSRNNKDKLRISREKTKLKHEEKIKISNKKYRDAHKKESHDYYVRKKKVMDSWGGDPKNNNNIAYIDFTLFK